MPNYYNILGVARDATKEEIKKAYRKLAHTYHPDKAGGDEAKFKEINEAYHVLSDDTKRTQYDQFGTTFEGTGAGPGFGGFGGGFRGDFNFGNIDLEDIFGDVFGFGRESADASRGKRGRDVSLDVEISLEEAFSGAERQLELKKYMKCDHCKGNGAEPGSPIVECKTCKGSGRVEDIGRTVFGSFRQVRSCAVCSGKGKIPEKSCKFCKGDGRILGFDRIRIVVPPGVAESEILKISGKGEVGTSGATSGDLYAKIHVRKHPQFKREGDTVYSQVSISFSQAVLGAKVDVSTLAGEVKLTIPPGVESGTLLRLRGKGMPHLAGGGYGDQYVEVEVKTPKKLNKKQKELFEKLREEGV